MNIKKQYLVFILVFLFLILGTTISYGAYSATSSTVESEGKITVNVTSTEELDAYNLDLKSNDGLIFNSCSKTENGAIININGSSIGYMNMSGKTKNLGTYIFTAPKVTEDKSYTITFLIDKKTTVTSKITVKAPVVETPKPETPSTTPTPKPETPPATVTKSSEAKLRNLGIKPDEYDFSGFSKNRNKENWEVTVPNSVTEVTVYGTALDEKAKVEGTGKVSLKEGNNTAKIKVTAEDGKTTKTYTLTIKRKTAAEEAVENGEARLKNLGIKPEEYDFTGFDSEKTEYSVEVPNEIEEVEVYATAKDSKAQITGTGMITLKEGINELPVEVIAVDGTKKVYTLKVTRKESEEIEATTTNTFGLSTLSISGLKLNSKFDVETYEYTVELEEDINSLDIQVEANEENATVEVIGNENLKQGENTITILVTNNETQEVVTYQVIVNKNIVQQEQIVQKSWLKPETWGKEEKIKIAIIIVLIILIIWAIILKIKISKESDSKRNVALPGADELDKAIAEHQELSEETNNSEENDTEFKYISENQVNQNYIEEIAKNRFSINDNSDETPNRRGRHF